MEPTRQEVRSRCTGNTTTWVLEDIDAAAVDAATQTTTTLIILG